MTGSVQDAEDLVQDCFVRWAQADRSEVQSPKAFLTTTVTRLALDYLQSARVRRESYIGPWIPEPLLAAPDHSDPERALELSESISTAFLIVLEILSPLERAIFLLRQVFDFDYTEIASIVGKSEANCRQVFHRAQQRVSARKPRFQSDSEQARKVARRFLSAVAGGDLHGVLELLAPDAIAWADGGGKVQAAVRPIEGRDRVARYYLGLANRLEGAVSRLVQVGESPAFVTYVRGRPIAVTSFAISGDQIQEIFLQVNPEKLSEIPPLT